ncbi:Spindle-body formation-associated protein [Lasallia pustulata]|uniref:Spindle-body formation-associated protein n=1 Tax=Lasallia pustulata TaxID=136370 RepID=A0A1W5D7F7_9LECA|nr:Spindle-body formation-associated protein [Lasallia pustulata]
MLGWLTSASRTDARQSQHEEGQSYISEPPETPAPVFAIRAFKTALFGTPHPDGSETNNQTQLVQLEIAEEEKRSPQEESSPSNARKASQNSKTLGNSMAKHDLFASPAKGILLTPGTGATRRKTVSFGALTVDACGKSGRGKSVEVLGVTPGDASDLWDLRDCESDQRGQTKLSKTLFKAHNELSAQKGPVEATESRAAFSRERPSDDHEKDKHSMMFTEETIDLDKPCSKSGQHWKAEYEKYHEKSNREMKKIIRYSQVAKSYAAKKDTEAMDLGEKLRKQLFKVTSMETKVAELAAQLATGISQGGHEDSRREKIVSELTEMTALAMRYKQKAERYRARIRGNASTSMAIDSLESESDKLENQASDGNRIDRTGSPDKLGEMTFLRDELARFRYRVTVAEDKAARLEEENFTLKKSLARVKECMGSYETRRKAREEYHKQKEAKLEAQKLEYKNRLAQMQVESVHHKVPQLDAQQVGAQRDGPSRETDSSSKSSRPQGYFNVKEAETDKDAAHNGRGSNERTEALGHLSQSSTAARDTGSTSAKLKVKPDVDIWSTEEEGDNCMKDLAKATASPQRRDKCYYNDLDNEKATFALKEIIHNLVEGEALPKPVLPSDRPETALYVQKTHESTTTSPPPVLPSPEAPIPSARRKAHDRWATVYSPRPSMVNFASSPSKQFPKGRVRQNAVIASHRTTAAIDLAMRPSASAQLPSSRASSLRSALPPDRAAAAKARLEQRMAEKRKLQEKGKENARP